MNISEKLKEISCDDIAPQSKGRKRTSYYVFNFIRIVLFLVCLAVFLFSLKSIIDNFEDFNSGEDFYESIVDEFNNIGKEGLTSPIYSAEKVVPLVKFDEMLLSKGELPPIVSNEELEEYLKVKNKLTILREQYPELVGWITIENTKINYPLMRAKDNQYYVNHAADGTPNYSGAIFADFRCTKAPEKTPNYVIYGHNIRSWGTMFNGITNFFNKSYFNSRPTIEISTFDGIYEYTIIAVFETDIYADYTRINFANTDMADFIGNIYDLASISREVEYNSNSKIVTLSTCSNSFDDDKRYALVGILTKSITPN